MKDKIDLTGTEWTYDGSLNTVWFTIGCTYKIVKHLRLGKVQLLTNDGLKSIFLSRLHTDFVQEND